MTTPETAAAIPTLAFGTAIGAAFESVFGRFRRFAKLAAIPFALMLFLAVLKFPVGLYVPDAELALFVVDLLPFAILGIAQSRAVLLGEAPGFLPPQPLGRRTWIYVGYSVLMVFITAVPLVILTIGAISITYVMSDGGGGFGSGSWMAVLGLLGFLGLLWVLARLSLVYPALAVDQKLGFAGAWRLTRGRGLKLLGILVVIFFATTLTGALGAALTGADFSIGVGGIAVLTPGIGLVEALLAEAPVMLWSAVISVIGYGLTMGACASAFAQLSGWGAPRQDILQRFE
jgi:hypothetical protein